MLIRRQFTFSLILLIVCVLVGCASRRTTQAHIRIQADAYVNPNMYGKAAPVEVSFYTLKTAAYFKSAQFYALQYTAATVLHDSLVRKETVEIRPNQQKLYVLSLPHTVHFIGMTAGFRDLNHATWRLILHLKTVQQKWYQRLWHHAITIGVVLHAVQVSAHLSRE